MTTARGKILWSIALIYLVKRLKFSFTPFDDVLYFTVTSSEIFTQYSFYLEHVHGIFQARLLEWVAVLFSRGSSQPRDQTRISCIGRQIVYHCATWKDSIQFISVQFSHSVVSDSLRPHELQYARPPCLSPSPGVHSNSCPSSRWCHPAYSFSVIPFSSCPQSLPASGSFQWVNSSHEVAKVLEFQL